LNLSRMRMALACLAMVLWAGWSTRAAPILPTGPGLTVEQQTLQGLQKLRVEVVPVTGKLKSAGISTSRVEELFRRELTDSGLQIIERRDAPMVRLVIFAATDAEQPESMAVSFVIAFHQEVRVKRIDVEMTVPTAFFMQTKLTTRSQARELVEWEVREMTRRVLKISNLASQEAKGKKSGER